MANVLYTGSQTKVMMGVESTFGTHATTAKGVGGFIQSVSMSERNNLQRAHAIGARATQLLPATTYDASGSIEYLFQSGRLLAYAMGTDTMTTSTLDRIHTLAATDVLSSFTLEIAHDSTTDIVRRYAGCVVNSFKLSGGANQLLTANAEILAATNSVATTTSATYATAVEPVQPPQYTTLKINNTLVPHVQSFDWTLNNNIVYPHAIGTRIVPTYAPAQRHIDLRATLNLEATEGALDYSEFLGDVSGAYTPADAGPTVNTQIILESTSGVLGTNKRGVQINMTNLSIDTLDISTPVDGLVTIELGAMATTFDSGSVVCWDSNTDATDYISQD